MNCIECGANIENGTYACEYCGARFSEEDVQIMLVSEKKRSKKRARKVVLVALLFIVILYSVVLSAVYFGGRYLEKKRKVATLKYEEGVEKYLSNMDNIDNYEYTEDSVVLYLSDEIWQSLTENEKIEFGHGVQNACTQYRENVGLNRIDTVTVQINDEYDNLLLYADNKGIVQTFDLPEG